MHGTVSSDHKQLRLAPTMVTIRLVQRFACWLREYRTEECMPSAKTRADHELVVVVRVVGGG